MPAKLPRIKILRGCPTKLPRIKILSNLRPNGDVKPQMSHHTPNPSPVESSPPALNLQPPDQPHPPTFDDNPMPSTAGLDSPTIDCSADPDDSWSRYLSTTRFGTNLFDANNAFNQINLYLML